MTVSAPRDGFVLAMAHHDALRRRRPGAAVIGQTPGAAPGQGPGRDRGPARHRADRDRRTPAAAAGADPLDDQLWGLRMVHADRARAVQPGDEGVTGRRSSTPASTPATPTSRRTSTAALSRNFATDIPEHRRPVRVRRAASTRSAGTTAATARTSPAPSARRPTASASPASRRTSRWSRSAAARTAASSSSSPVVNALTYAGDVGLDVVNMSFYVDPWLYNCTAQPGRLPAGAGASSGRSSRRMNRALNYAHGHGVTLVGALGNNHEDLGNPRTDITSPDYPVGHRVPAADRQRDLLSTCRSRART